MSNCEECGWPTEACECEPERSAGSLERAGSARAWQCNLGNGQWDHDWQEKHDESGGVDGGPSDQWSWRECRVCGEIEAPNEKVSHTAPTTT